MEAMDRLMASIDFLSSDILQDDPDVDVLKSDVFSVRHWAKTLQEQLREVEGDACNNAESR